MLTATARKMDAAAMPICSRDGIDDGRGGARTRRSPMTQS